MGVSVLVGRGRVRAQLGHLSAKHSPLRRIWRGPVRVRSFCSLRALQCRAAGMLAFCMPVSAVLSQVHSGFVALSTRSK